jgi:hypothetical protein
MSIVAWVTLTVALRLACDFADNGLVQIVCRRFRLAQRTLRGKSSAGLLGSHHRRHRNPGNASVFRVEDPGKSSTRLLSCAAALVMKMAPWPECS